MRKNFTRCQTVDCKRRLMKVFAPELVCEACKQPVVYPAADPRAEMLALFEEGDALLNQAALKFAALKTRAGRAGLGAVFEHARDIGDALDETELETKWIREALTDAKECA